MIDQRTEEEIRTNALRLGAEKLAEGCNGFAEQHFALARRHGATEEEIATAHANAEQLSLNRRDLLRLAAASAAGLASTSISSPLITLYAPSVVSAQSSAGAQVAWIRAVRSPNPSAGQPTVRLVGISPSGSIAAQIDPAPGAILRVPDGTQIVEVTTRLGSTTATSVVDLFDAATGHMIREITGGSLALHGSKDQNFDGPALAVSPDGRLLAVLHQLHGIQPGTEQQVTKAGPSANTSISLTTGHQLVAYSVELYDLQAGQLLSSYDLGAAANNNLIGYLVFAPSGSALHVFTTQDLGPQQRRNLTITTLSVASGQLQPEKQASNGASGQTLPAEEVAGPPTLRFLSDGTTLVRFDVPNHVRFFGAAVPALIADLDVGTDPPKRNAWPLGIFTPKGATLYVVNSRTGTIRVVDLASRALTRTTTVPLGGLTQTPQGRPALNDAVAVSPEGARMYLIDGRAGTGLTVLHLPDLQLEATWQADKAVMGVWLAPDGQTVFARTLNQVYTLNQGGTLIAVAPVGSDIFGFLAGREA